MHNEHVVSVGKADARRNHRTHYWALRQQARGSAALVVDAGSFPPRVCGGLGVLVVAPLWWWGVVFDLWIVVASIEMMACAKGLPSFVGVVSLCGLSSHVMQIFLMPSLSGLGDSFFGFVL